MRCLKQLSSTRVISQDASSSRTSTAVVTNLDLILTSRHWTPDCMPVSQKILPICRPGLRRAGGPPGWPGAESLRLGRDGQGVAPRRSPPTATTRQPRDIATPRTHRYRRGLSLGRRAVGLTADGMQMAAERRTSRRQEKLGSERAGTRLCHSVESFGVMRSCEQGVGRGAHS
jgi:hypothetical protein